VTWKERLDQRTQEILSSTDLTGSDRLTIADPNSQATGLSRERVSITEARRRAMIDLNLSDRWYDYQFGSAPGDDGAAQTQAEDTRESLQDELSEGRPEVTVGDIDTEPVREAVENAVPGTGNDAPSVTPTSSSGGAGGVGAVVAVVLALLAGAAALLGGGR
jgi:hypothetical protein